MQSQRKVTITKVVHSSLLHKAAIVKLDGDTDARISFFGKERAPQCGDYVQDGKLHLVDD